MKPGVQALQSLPLLADLSERDLAALDQSADLVRFGPDETLFQAGDQLSELNYLLAGQIGATCPEAEDNNPFADILLPVRPLCLPAVLLGLPTPAGAYTLSAGRLITLPAHRLQEMARRNAGLARSFLDHALQETHQQALEIRSLKLQSSPQRLAAYLIGLIDDPEATPARFVLPIHKEHLAAKIGCSKENLSRAFVTLRGLGVVTQLRTVIAHDVPALRAFAIASGWRKKRARVTKPDPRKTAGGSKSGSQAAITKLAGEFLRGSRPSSP
jgi:CRP/FNR family transcriptional activator FtrB